MVGHMTLDHGIGVRIPASQPLLWEGFLRWEEMLTVEESTLQ